MTRTVHYGVPSREQRRAYTTVLRSLAALSSLQSPSTLPAAHADPVARAPLWAAAQDYPSATGHGVGAALNRREGIKGLYGVRSDVKKCLITFNIFRSGRHRLQTGYQPAHFPRGLFCDKR